MKKFKRTMALVMCLTLMLTFAMSASAKSTDEEISPYVSVSQCLKCGGSVIHKITKDGPYADFKECKHGLNGVDRYDRYDVTDDFGCQQCGNRGTEKYSEYVFLQCTGYQVTR